MWYHYRDAGQEANGSENVIMVEFLGDYPLMPTQKPLVHFDIMSDFGFFDRLRILFGGRMKQSGTLYADWNVGEEECVVMVQNIWIGREPSDKGHGDSFSYADSSMVKK